MNELDVSFFKNLAFYIFSIYIFVDTINILFNYNLYRKNNIFGSIFSKENNLISEYFKKSKVFVKLFSTSFIYLVIARLALLIFVLLGYKIIFALFLIQLVIFYRNYLYMDASEKLCLTILFGFTIYDVFEIQSVKELGLLFICISIFIVYFSTAYHKIRSSIWKNGEVMPIIFSSESVEEQYFANYFYKNPKVSKIVCWGLMLFQLTFFLSLLNYNLLLLYLSLGVFFHLINMYFLKLYSFFIIFVSTYPIIYYFGVKINWILFH